MKLFQWLISENDFLKAQRAVAQAQLKNFESQQDIIITPKDITPNVTVDQGLLLTGTYESIYALSEEEWKKSKAANKPRKQTMK